METKKILVTATTFPTFLKGDVTPPFVYELSKRLAKNKDLKIVVSTPYIKRAKTYKEREGMKIYRYKYGFTSLCDGAILPNLKKNKLLYFQIPFFLIASFFNLRKLVKEEKIDIIHAHWIIPQGFIAVLYKKLFRKKNLKIICTSHGGDIFGLQNPFMKKIKRWTLNNVDRLTVVSNAIKEEVKKLDARDNLPIEVVPMGVDAELFNPDKYDSKIKEKYGIEGSFLLFVGRLAEKKGVKYLIDAMPAVIQEHPKTKLLIVGSGSLENELKKQIKNLNLENDVIFTGAIPNNELPSYYATADIFIGPSIIAKGGDAEGFGLVFVEALMSKTCVITSDFKAISDIIKNEDTGIQIDVRNQKIFSEKIIKLIDNAKERKRLVENGYNFVKDNFTWDIITDKYRNLIDKMI